MSAAGWQTDGWNIGFLCGRGDRLYNYQHYRLRGIEMDFCYALNALREGKRVARKGWNRKNMFIFFNPGSEVKVTEGRPLASAFPIGTECRMLPYIMMKTADPVLTFVPWLCSQTDLLASDWEIV